MSCEDQAFSPMPKFCNTQRNLVGRHWTGQSVKCLGKLKRDKHGFMVCQKCGISWGRAA